MNQKTALIIGLLLYVVSAGVAFAFFQGNGGNGNYKPPVEEVAKDPDQGPLTESCPLNGKLYTEGQRQLWEKRRPLGLMVENHEESRPQSGLNSADIIYEVVAEGGITRFLSIFYCDNPEIVGPVRSARIYFIRLIQGYGNHPLYGHVGGANTPGPADALGELRDLGWAGYNNLNQFSVPFPNYYRDYDRLPGVATEHTMYTDTNKLWDYAAKNFKLTNVDEDGVAWDETFQPWKIAKEAKEDGSVSSIAFSHWESMAANYSIQWDYDAEKKAFVRTNGGQPHMDKNTGEQLQAENVILVFTEESEANDGYDAGTHLLYDLESGGDALIFQNGNVVEGTWEKEEFESPMLFFDENGDEIEIVPGKVWVHVVPTDTEVDYES